MSKFFKTFHLQTPLLPTSFLRTPRALFLNSSIFPSISPSQSSPVLWEHCCEDSTPQLSFLLSGAVSVVQLFVVLRCKQHHQH